MTNASGLHRPSAARWTFVVSPPRERPRAWSAGSPAGAPFDGPRHAGDDVALALDYRTNRSDPRVVGSDFWTNRRQCEWRLVTPTFSAFTHALGL
ncbi:hypothetical protein GCM10017750_68760 [Streptomyces racemochromogenes]